MLEEYIIRTSKREEFIDITGYVRQCVRRSGIEEGVVVVYTPHTTAALTINENADPSVKEDIIEFLRRMIPRDGNYSHTEGNSDAHIKSSLLGVSLNLLLSRRRLLLGTWQGIFFCEFDGPRTRKFYVKVMGE
ncbi:MAG TPA: YjbQ family protein [Methanothermococcus okinawensis]|uniref:YjbQ family protein n=1 Tax=Methanothermococcus okinawensis TaxID=155863 RepID=A0A832ZJU9_9EURY|nr:YjbQ family protein [Methanococcaceae archaeon]HIP84016.1 YjbQ family protein [Methanothermococcus okinawensis]HIP91486.1 YjbQ family protein [Methanothermococcus okinawensis]